jgi:carbon-monoxide dehydrogenase medium subunit
MKPAPFSLHLPDTLPEALDMLASMSNARVIAGGQSLMPMLNMRLAMPDDVIDLNGIGSLSGIREEGGNIVIGAMTRQREIEFSPLVGKALPLLHEAILNVGHRQTRNRGTIGGSLCHLDPSAEQPTIAVAMDATLSIQGNRGSRNVPMQEFAAGLMTTCLEEDEMLTGVRFTPWAEDHGFSFVEFGRRHGDFAIVSAAVLVQLAHDGSVSRVSLTLGGVGDVPFRVTPGEAILVGNIPSAAAIKAASVEASRFAALDDPAYPSWYRQRVAAKLLERAIAQAVQRARQAQEVMQ